MWHWAHVPVRHCDPWWEHETEWHRNWKGCFPAECQEVVQLDNSTGEVHIADVKAKNGYVIEFQNSKIELDELDARERFYGNMVWVVNAAKFRSTFHILCKIPPPDSELARQITIVRQPRIGRDWKEEVVFCWNSSISTPVAGLTLYNLGMVSKERTTLFEIREKVEKAYQGHHLFQWQRPHAAWMSASKAVFLDFGDTYMWTIMKYNESTNCVVAVDKNAFIRAFGGGRSTL